MQKITQLRISRALGFLMAAIVILPAHLVGSAAYASPGGSPGVIASVRYDGNGPGSVSLSWDAPRAQGTLPVTDYAIEYRGVGGSWTVFDDGVSLARAATVTGLEPGREYDFRIAAVNPAGAGPASALGIGEQFMSSGTATCAMNPVNQYICFEGDEPRVAATSYDDPNKILVPVRVNDVTTQVGYSQSWNVDLQCVLSRSKGVICITRFNEQGQQGRGYTGAPTGNFVVEGLPDDIVDVSVVGNTACALSSAGELWCWGRWSTDRYGRHIVTPVLQFRGVTEIGGLCAIQSDQTITCLATDTHTYRWVSNPAVPTALELDGQRDTTCAITTARTVICFSALNFAYSTIANLSDVVEFDLRQGHWCAVNSTGLVTCSGANESGQLGDGTYASGPTTARIPEPVAHLATSDDASGPTRRSCAIGVSATVYCWGSLVQGRGISTVPRVMSGFGAWTAHAAIAPSKITSLTQTGRTARSVTVSWTAPAAGDFAIDSYVIAWRVAGGVWATDTLPGRATSWQSPEVPKDSIVQTRIAAVSQAGAGTASTVVDAKTASPPLRPTAPLVTSTTANTVTISWRPTSSPYEPVTGYRIEWSTDRKTWQTRTATSTESAATITGLSAGSAIDIRLAAENAAGVSSFSDTITTFTSGLVSHTIVVQDSTGQPVYGGRVTWRKPDGSFESALDYGLTVEGRATFPFIPAGRIDVSLRNVQLLGGAIADYNKSTIIGFSTDSLIMLPPEPSESQHVVRVVLANGLPVVGATVSATELYEVAAVDGATFTSPALISDGVTNEFGEVYLTGYSTEDSMVRVEYNDGILIQRVTKNLGERDVEIVMEDMPWIEPPLVTTEARVGDLVTVNITTTGFAESAADVTRAANPATVSIQPPKGASQTCAGKKLSATVSADGTATLQVCASKSGRYLLRGQGVVSTGAISLNVNGVAPLPVTRARAVSPSHKTVTVSWNAPSFLGGSPVKKYTVTLRSGKKTLTKVVTGTSVSFDNLPGTTKWTATVTATSKSGTSEPVVMLVPVS
jgi:hypothetical protein